MIPKVADLGTSFKGAFLYYGHDKGLDDDGNHFTSSDRVAHFEAVNMLAKTPEAAWKMMAYTAMNARELQKAYAAANDNKYRPGGRLPANTVYSYSLSWARDQHPDHPHMIAQAYDTLRSLGFSDHQAGFFIHNDTDHPHIHVVVNRINPITGTAHRPQKDYYSLSQWARQYEKETGLRCLEREFNWNEREKLGPEAYNKIKDKNQKQLNSSAAWNDRKKNKKLNEQEKRQGQWDEINRKKAYAKEIKEAAKDRNYAERYRAKEFDFKPTREQKERFFEEERLRDHSTRSHANRAVYKKESNALEVQKNRLQWERTQFNHQWNNKLTAERNKTWSVIKPKYSHVYKDLAREKSLTMKQLRQEKWELKKLTSFDGRNGLIPGLIKWGINQIIYESDFAELQKKQKSIDAYYEKARKQIFERMSKDVEKKMAGFYEERKAARKSLDDRHNQKAILAVQRYHEGMEAQKRGEYAKHSKKLADEQAVRERKLQFARSSGSAAKKADQAQQSAAVKPAFSKRNGNARATFNLANDNRKQAQANDNRIPQKVAARASLNAGKVSKTDNQVRKQIAADKRDAAQPRRIQPELKQLRAPTPRLHLQPPGPPVVTPGSIPPAQPQKPAAVSRPLDRQFNARADGLATKFARAGTDNAAVKPVSVQPAAVAKPSGIMALKQAFQPKSDLAALKQTFSKTVQNQPASNAASLSPVLTKQPGLAELKKTHGQTRPQAVLPPAPANVATPAAAPKSSGVAALKKAFQPKAGLAALKSQFKARSGNTTANVNKATNSGDVHKPAAAPAGVSKPTTIGALKAAYNSLNVAKTDGARTLQHTPPKDNKPK